MRNGLFHCGCIKGRTAEDVVEDWFEEVKNNNLQEVIKSGLDRDISLLRP